MNKKSGFTIMELITVVVIIGVLAAIALPSYRIQMLKMKNQEAIRILMTLWEAQKEYKRENGVYFPILFTYDLDFINTTLNTSIPTPKNFGSIQAAGNGQATCIGPTKRYLSSMGSNTASYLLSVLEDGRVVCLGAVGCSDPICLKMGFKTDW